MWDLIVSVPDHCLSFYIVWSFGTVEFNTFFWEQRSAQSGASRRERCRIRPGLGDVRDVASAIISHE